MRRDLFSVDESSEEDSPIEDEEFMVKHQEWINNVMKDEMSFTVCDYLESFLFRSQTLARKAIECAHTPPTW